MNELKNITVNFGAQDVLCEVSLSLNPGQITAVLGINGAGKSTLMHVIAQKIKPNSGTVRFESKVSMVHQELMLQPQMTVAENLFINELSRFHAFGFFSKKKLFAEAKQTLKRFAIALDEKKIVSDLTTGQAQLLEIARALAHADKNGVLILDEPTTALTRAETKVLFSKLQQLKKDFQLSILFVSHRLDEVFELCDQLIVLRDGRLKLACEVSETNQSSVVEAMTGHRLRDLSRNEGKSQEGFEKNNDDVALTVEPFSIGDGSKKVLFDLDQPVSLAKQKITGIAGLMGSGRSLFLRGVAESHEPLPKGDLKINLSSKKKNKSRISYLHEDRKNAGLFEELSSLENISIASKRLTEKASRIFSTLGVFAKHPNVERLRARELSGGNQQKLLVGRALINDPQLLLLDEPTKGVDPKARDDIHALLRKCRNENRVVTLVSSDFEELAGISDEVIFISRGRVVSKVERPMNAAEISNELLRIESNENISVF